MLTSGHTLHLRLGPSWILCMRKGCKGIFQVFSRQHNSSLKILICKKIQYLLMLEQQEMKAIRRPLQHPSHVQPMWLNWDLHGIASHSPSTNELLLLDQVIQNYLSHLVEGLDVETLKYNMVFTIYYNQSMYRYIILWMYSDNISFIFEI